MSLTNQPTNLFYEKISERKEGSGLLKDEAEADEPEEEDHPTRNVQEEQRQPVYQGKVLQTEPSPL